MNSNIIIGEKKWILFGATGRIGRSIYTENQKNYLTFGRSQTSDYQIEFTMSEKLQKLIKTVLEEEIFEGSVKAYETGLCLPSSTLLSLEQIRKITSVISNFFDEVNKKSGK